MIPKMPDEYKGVYVFNPAYTKSDGTNNGSRKWTKEEEEWVMNLVDEGFSLPQIAISTDRETHSVSMKVKRLKKKTGAYNEKHIQQKYDSNKEFYDLLQPKSILDCFSGIKRYWKCIEPNTIDNDINTDLEAGNHLDANVLMSQLISEGKSFNVVDIDPFGSAYDYFDNAYQLATDGIIVTFGEMGHKRWKRLDYVGERYGIESIDNFTSQSIVNYYLLKYDDLTLWRVDDYSHISRAYFIKGDLQIGKN